MDIKMNFLKYIVLSFCLLGIVSVASASDYKPTKIYMFGFATSLNDSTVFFTDIQAVNAYVENNRTRFLVGRETYAYQLREYIEKATSIVRPMCVVLYADTEKRAIKKYLALQNKLTKKGKQKYNINNVSSPSFTFKPFIPELTTETNIQVVNKSKDTKKKKAVSK